MDVQTIISIIVGVISVGTLVYGAGVLSQKVKRNEKDIELILTDIKSIPKIQATTEAILGLIKTSENGIAKSFSPLSLTENGQRISDSLGAVDMVNRHWDTILEKILADNITSESNLYDIQKTCFDIGNNYSKIVSEEDFNKIKDFAFRNGNNLYDYDILFGILIRDKFFKDNNLEIKKLKEN